MKRCVIFDLDGTLADPSHRVQYVDGTPFIGARVTVVKAIDVLQSGKKGLVMDMPNPEIALVQFDDSEQDIIGCKISCLEVKPDWERFFDDMEDDVLIAPMVDLLNALKRDFPIALCSGRPETYRTKTVTWLKRHSITFEALYLRKAGDQRSDDIVKREMLNCIRADGLEPWIAVEDRASVVKMWRAEGLICLQCADGNF
jgi:phosphoglycolate phosphatase-like HAD superfamily hydrolase